MSLKMNCVWGLLLGLLLPLRALADAQVKPLTDVVAKPLATAVWSAPPAEALPAPLGQATLGKLRFVEPGPIRQAAAQVVAGRAALVNLRCADSLPAMRKAAEALLDDVPSAVAQPMVRDLFGVLLLCADRIGDVPSAERAATVLSAQSEPLPTDLALIMPRYQHGTPFGPPRAPVRVESDPPGATVIRNTQVLGTAPLWVDGGRPDVDVLYVEQPGMRKVRRPLGSGETLFLSLRPEDRLPLLLDQVASLPLGSDAQAALLKELSASAAVATQLGGKLLIFGPKVKEGAPVAGESLLARVYDLDRRDWLGPVSEVAIGNPAAQADALLALAAGTAAQAQVTSAPATASPAPKAVAAKAPADDKKSSGWKLPFAKTKWYTWVVAGGVAALIGGLLIAERFSSEKITVTATH
ncbi:MAG: hypothetical protein JNM40_15165 [Myxococcales bacterium]|nr:hypothetical protein [Myxococcales bacterium]